jgi:hypothetical protein
LRKGILQPPGVPFVNRSDLLSEPELAPKLFFNTRIFNKQGQKLKKSYFDALATVQRSSVAAALKNNT